MTRRLFDDLRFVPIAYATCMWCHNLVSNPHSVWSNGGPDADNTGEDIWYLEGHVGTSKVHDSCLQGLADRFKVGGAV